MILKSLQLQVIEMILQKQQHHQQQQQFHHNFQSAFVLEEI
jgi:hypothetical protein